MKKPPVTKNRPDVTRRNLPHWQIGGAWYFITFRTRGIALTPAARDAVADAILFNHNQKYALAAAVIMPDHVHRLLMPLGRNEKEYYSLSEFLGPLKGFSAMRVNRLIGRSGGLWLDESFDRIVRDEGEWSEKFDYIRNNPVKAGLAEKPAEYPWLLDRDDFLRHW